MAMVPGFAIQADTASMEGHAPDGRTYSDDGILLDSVVSNVLAVLHGARRWPRKFKH